MQKPRLETALRLLVYGAMIAVSFGWLLRPLNDPDFFWHLKTGEWISQHRELPAEDPFNYTSRAVQPAGQRFVLTAYWLSQVGYHAVHALLGFPGIAALRFLIALLFVLALLKLRRGDPVIHAALVLAILPLFYAFYPLDRPQAFSFLFFAGLLILLERERTGAIPASGWASFLPIPALMLLWANMHGGHAIGQLVIVLYLAMEAVKFAHPALRPVGREQYRRLLIAGLAGLAASLANPNTYHATQLSLASSPNLARNIEYLSTPEFYRTMRQPLVFIFWGALPLAAAYCLSTAARPDLTLIALLAGTGYWGFTHIRFVPFFLVAALPAIGLFLSAQRVRAWARPLAVAGSVLLVAFFSRHELPSRERVGRALGVNADIYPVEAADFVLANRLKGNLYNTYLWGGYLLWRLGPERKVFVDGRGINPQATFQSLSINQATALRGHDSPTWKTLLRQLGVGYAVIPRVNLHQGIVLDDARNLARALLEDPEWAAVHVDDIALVFVLRTPEHRDVVARHAVPRELVLGWDLRNDVALGNQLVSQGRREEAAAAYRRALRADPRNHDAWHNLGCVLGELGRLDEAVAAFEETLRLKPDHPTARTNLQRIPGRGRR